MPKFYEIDDRIRACLDLETGEIDVERLEALQMERAEKIDNILSWIKELRSDADGIYEEEKKLKKRREQKTKHADELEDFLTRFVFRPREKFETARNAIGWRRSSSVEFTDAEKALKWCEEHAESAIRYAPPTLDRMELKSLIKAGFEIDGAELVERDNLQIR